LTETSGFTSIKFIPGTEDQLILALKAGLDKETNELVSTLEVYDLKGNEVMAETRVATGIYAGVEFL
jgi:soluble calcium-activated nucleotidase 1